MKKENYLYSGLGERLSFEWKIYLAALVFIIIAALMFFTRKIDWNNLGKNNLKSQEETE